MSKIELFNEDCLSVLPSFKEHSVDLVVCDLPYGVLNKSIGEVSLLTIEHYIENQG